MLPLLDMPLEVLEAICRPLQLRDRLALTSCCRTLLEWPGVAESAHLWGALGRDIKLGRAPDWELPPAGFFTRRAAGLRALHVEFCQDNAEEASADLEALLGALGGSGLTDLEISGFRDIGLTAGVAFQPLSRLTALTRLKVPTGLRAVPAHLSALPGLAHLDLGGNLGLGCPGNTALFKGLECLSALTSLDLSRCHLRALPPQLSSLTRLQVLLLHDNRQLGEEGEATLEGLAHLLGLTGLDIGVCGLKTLPPQLSLLTCLQMLRLYGNNCQWLREEGEAELNVLHHLPALRTLDLSWCGLHAVPQQLTALPALRALNLNGNQALSIKGPAETFPVLEELTGLTSLSIRRCSLTRAPPQLTSLTALANLDLGENPLGAPSEEEEEEEEEGDAFLPLGHLTALTRLDLSTTALRRLNVYISGLHSPAPQALLELVQRGLHVSGRL